jgi:hypothetical protein
MASKKASDAITGFRWDPFGFSALSPFLSLLLALSLCHFHQRLHGGLEAGFRRNIFAISAPSLSVSLCRSDRSLLTMSHSLRFHFRLNGGLGAGIRWNAFGFEREK